MLSESQKQQIIQTLGSKGVQAKCPMCGRSRFSVVDSYIRNALQDDIKKVALDGPAVPCAAILCMHCGFISQHALGVLGLFPGKES